MFRRMIFPIVLGVVGAAILCALGVWQLQRLEWKQGILANIEARLSADLVDLPDAPNPETDNYLGVELAGRLVGPELHVLVSLKPDGPGFRVIRLLEMLGDRTVLVDLGYVSEADKDLPRSEADVLIQGNLIWPDETDGYTPEPDFDGNIWFARDVDSMAEVLGSEPYMVAMRSSTPALPTKPMPVTINISNDHLQYAITWFSLMVIWIVMTLFLLWSIKRAKV